MKSYMQVFAMTLALSLLACGGEGALSIRNGFEVDNSGWNVFGGTNDATRVASGTNGVTSASGSFHAEATGPNNGQTDDGSAATNWGAYSSTFGGGYKTTLDIYLKFGTANDTRFDWDSAINDSSGAHLRDYVFNGGYYNDTDVTGSGDRFVFTQAITQLAAAPSQRTRVAIRSRSPARDGTRLSTNFTITAGFWQLI